jgi:hypothetical protein
MKRHQDQEQEISDSRTDQTGIRDRAREFISQTPLPHQSGQNCKIALVSPEHIPQIWDTVHRHLELMTPHSEGELEPEDFYEALTNAEMQLWVAVNDGDIIASMVSQIIPYPRKQVLRIISIAGKGVEQWMQFLPMVEDWALSVGCTSLECWGRKGWLKILKDWKCSYHIITKDLTARMH